MSNSKILKNSAFLYVRLLFTLVIGLLTTRIVINALGIEDYGIYGVVAGLVTMFGFMNAAMSASTQRYLSFNLGIKDTKKLQETFSASANIHFLIGLLSFLLAEAVGLWVINNFLDIPGKRLTEANAVFHLSLIVFFFGIVQAPFHAATIAYERMSAYTYISIVEAILKLSAACILLIAPLDRLVLYSQLLAVISVLSFFSYAFYVQVQLKEIKYIKYFDKVYYKEILSFSGWNLFGNIAAVARGQGINILINIFFGVALNAAYAVTMMVQGVLTQFAASIQQAINPQIIKSYARNDKGRTEQLMHASSKYSFFVMLILITPFYLNLDFILKVWLGTVPEYTSLFVSYVFVLLLIDVLSNSLMVGLQSTGRIKAYHVTVGLIVLLNFPLTWVAFNVIPEPKLAFEMMILVSLVSFFVRLCFVRAQMGYEIKGFLKSVIVKIFFVMVVFLVPLTFIKKIELLSGFLKLVVDVALSTLSLMSIIYLIGTAKAERSYLNRIVKKKLSYGAD